MNVKTTAKDFLMHVAAIILLYTGTVALLNLLFRVINAAFPQVGAGYYYNGTISFPVATLIVVFPLFLILSKLLHNDYKKEPAKKEYAVRRWLIYITLFVAGGILAGDLITLIYFFLDGRELTVAFLLKVLSVFVVTGGIFGYVLDDLKDRLGKNRVRFWTGVATVLVLGGIIAGFAVMGTPQTQRLERYDSQKISDLQNIQWQIINYWQQKGEIPQTLETLRDSISGFVPPRDPQTGEDYGYRMTGELSFELCADFNRPTRRATASRVPAIVKFPGGSNENSWQHGAGDECFPRTIDPELYPVREPAPPKRSASGALEL